MSALLIVAVALLAYANGANDNFKGVATLFGSGTARYRRALAWATITTGAGSLLALGFSRRLVATFSGLGLVPDEVAGAPGFLLAAGLGAALTVLVATRAGLPVSTTHALTGGLVGAGLAATGGGIDFGLLGTSILLPLALSPLVAMALSLLIYPGLRRLRRAAGIRRQSCLCVGARFEPVTAQPDGTLVLARTGVVVRTGRAADCVERYQGRVLGVQAGTVLDAVHYLSGGAVGFARGLNDTPKIAAVLLAAQAVAPGAGFAMVAAVMALGGILSARRVAETMSRRITRMNPGQGIAANLVSSGLVVLASRFGLPVSTTHVSVGALFGIGVANRTARRRTILTIVLAWIATLPLGVLLAAAVYVVGAADTPRPDPAASASAAPGPAADSGASAAAGTTPTPAAEATAAQPRKGARARDFGVPFDGTPGALNAITDVGGVEVGHATLIRGRGPLVTGKGPVRTGVTAIFPLGRTATEGVTAGWSALNGDGEMTGTVFLDEFGELYGPVMLTNTLSVGAVHAAVIEWSRRHVADAEALYARSLPVVAETWDGHLNDIYGQHVAREDVFRALDGAAGGPVEEGNAGGGTGMIAFGFKAGIGTASRVFATGQGRFTLGVLVQANYGRRPQLRIAGVPVGEAIADLLPGEGGAPAALGRSIIVIIATDAPLLPIQLQRLARRAAPGLGRTGGTAMDGSGDLFLAFSTANRLAPGATRMRTLRMMTDLDPLFEATVQATEEAVVNALVAARTMEGAGGRVAHALPHDRLREALRAYNRRRE